jgi:hypothetical protein
MSAEGSNSWTAKSRKPWSEGGVRESCRGGWELQGWVGAAGVDGRDAGVRERVKERCRGEGELQGRGRAAGVKERCRGEGELQG